jgi:hypothetical protein
MTGQLGVIYVLHFHQPYWHARHYTGNAESSAGLKVPHVELTVLSVIRGRNPGGFTQEGVADNGSSASTTLLR